MIRNLLFFAGAVAVSLLAAWWRWPDSAHAIAVVKAGGGKARHAVAFRSGPASYQLVATATVLPPWSGDARLAVEGDPPLRWSAALSRPAVEVGLYDFPRLEGDVIRGLRPRHHVALWVDLRAGDDVDPVCGMRCDAGALREGGRCFCSEACKARFLAGPGAFPASPRGEYRLSLRDATTGAPLLAIPIVFGAEPGGDHGAHH
jgi:YHS domain-containing protein